MKKQSKTVVVKCDWCSYSGWAHNNKDNGECYYCKGTGFRKARLQVYLVIGGPFDKQRLTHDEAGDAYLRFNPSTDVLPRPTRREKAPCVLIHESVWGCLLAGQESGPSNR